MGLKKFKFRLLDLECRVQVSSSTFFGVHEEGSSFAKPHTLE